VLILARHGSTALNEAGILQGEQDETLSPRGASEARALTRWLTARYEPRRIISSELLRARQTADVVAAEIGVRVETHALLHERRWGPFTGMTRDELLAARRQRGLGDDSPTQDWRGCDEVESDREIWGRFSRFATETGVLDESRLSDSLVLTHSGVLKACLHESFGIPVDRVRCFRIETGTALVLSVRENGLELTEMWRNDVRFERA
jgi:glucosyl-3-phosphoglycerate phosphatase